MSGFTVETAGGEVLLTWLVHDPNVSPLVRAWYLDPAAAAHLAWQLDCAARRAGAEAVRLAGGEVREAGDENRRG